MVEAVGTGADEEEEEEADKVRPTTPARTERANPTARRTTDAGLAPLEERLLPHRLLPAVGGWVVALESWTARASSSSSLTVRGIERIGGEAWFVGSLVRWFVGSLVRSGRVGEERRQSRGGGGDWTENMGVSWNESEGGGRTPIQSEQL